MDLKKYIESLSKEDLKNLLECKNDKELKEHLYDFITNIFNGNSIGFKLHNGNRDFYINTSKVSNLKVYKKGSKQANEY